ncbi:hypothetical protein E4U43_002268, partial [Claviceps pusilla]
KRTPGHQDTRTPGHQTTPDDTISPRTADSTRTKRLVHSCIPSISVSISVSISISMLHLHPPAIVIHAIDAFKAIETFQTSFQAFQALQALQMMQTLLPTMMRSLGRGENCKSPYEVYYAELKPD